MSSSIDTTRAYGLDFAFPVRDKVVGRCLAEHGEFARIEQDLIVSLLAGGTPGVFLDVGANIGAIGLPVATRSPGCAVIAIEANRRLATLLAGNVVGNRLENVEVINAAAGAAPGLLTFPAPELGKTLNFGDIHPGLIAMNPDMPSETVRVCTLDEVAAPGATRVVKLDVQGSERDIVAGAPRILIEERPVWVFETMQNETSQAVLQTFLDAEYDLYWLFSPFVTAKADKRPPIPGVLRGDTSAVAAPRGKPIPLNMPRISSASDRRPDHSEAYPYLREYGF